MNNVLLTLGALLVGILTALVAVPLAIDWNSYRGAFEEEASRILGRDVRVGGAVAVRLLPAPYVRFEKLRVADTASTSGDPLFRADSLTMRLSIGALLRGALEADNVDLQKPALRLTADKDGNGNWRSLQITAGSLPFLPSNVALKSVGIASGRLTLVGPSGRDLAVFDGIDGEFSAESSSGPFRFKGTAFLGGAGPGLETAREIRVSAGALEADGSLNARASIRAPKSGNAYLFEGRILDIRDKMRVEGDLTAMFPIASEFATGPTKESRASDRKSDEPSAAYELKGRLTGDVNGARLADLSLALDDVADPQLITGEVATTWGTTPRFDLTLSSRSLNLDRFAAAKTDSDPLDTARAALNLVLGALPDDAEASASLRADRVILSSDTATAVTVVMARTGPLLELKSLRAELPGGTRLEATGAISRDTRTLAFSGPVRVNGQNLARFAAWARGKGRRASATAGPVSPEAESGVQRYDGPFSLDAQLSMAGGSIDLTEARADFNGMPITGEIKVQTEGRRKIGVVLDAERLDLARLWPGGFNAGALRTLLTGKSNGSPGAANNILRYTVFAYDPATADLTLRIKADELRLGDLRQAIDVKNTDIAISFAKGALEVERVKLTTPHGLDVDLEGRLSGMPGAPLSGPTANPLPVAQGAGAVRSGTIRFILGAATASAAAEAFELLEVPQSLRPNDRFLDTLGAVRIAGSVTIAARSATSIGIDFDGAVDGGRLEGSLAFAGGLDNWRASPVVARMALDSPRVERWLELSGLAASQTTGARLAGRGVIILRGEGTPETGLTVYSTLSSKDLSAAYQGFVALPSAKPVQLDGIVALTARDAADALALAGVAPALGASGAPVAGQVKVASQADALRFETAALTIGGSTLSGELTLSASTTEPGTRIADARVVVDSLSVPGVLAALTDRRIAKSEGDDSMWPAEPLTLSTLDGLNSKIDLTAQRAVIDGAVALADARARVRLAPGKMWIDELSGRALGGTFSGKAMLERGPGGAKFTASGDFKDIDAGKLQRGINLPVSISATTVGQGISARGIVASLSGSGEVSLGAGKIAGVAPVAIAEIANRVLETRELPSMEVVIADIERNLEASTLEIRPRKLPVRISDGSARVSTTPFETDSGEARVDVAVDLAALRQSHEWRIETRTKPPPSGKVKGLMPPVVITSTGNLAAADNWMTAKNFTAFEQELSLRKLERDSEELERARRAAEEARLKQEAEEAARLAAARAAAEAAAGQPPASGSPSPSSSGSTPATPPVSTRTQGLQSSTSTSTRPESDGTPDAPTPATAQPKSGVAQPSDSTAPVTISAPPPPRPARSGQLPRKSDEQFLRPFQNP